MTARLRLRSVFTSVCLALLLFTTGAFAGVKVESDPSADFSGFRTYTWHKGLPAAYPHIQEWIVDTVVAELASVGLTEAANADDADLLLATYAFGSTEVGAVSGFFRDPGWSWGIITYDIRRVDSGTLVVALAENDPDGADGEKVEDKLVWLAVADGVLVPREEGPLKKKIETITKKMFKRYPSR